MTEMDYRSPQTPDKPQKRRHLPHRYASGLIVGLGVVANAAAVADLFTKHIGVIGVVAGILTIIVGLYLLLGRWGKPVGWQTMLAVAIIVAGSVTLSLILQKGGYIDTGPTPPSGVTPGVTDKGKRYTLAANESLDLDDGNETILVQQTSAQSPADLYFSDWAYLEASVKSFYPYQAPKNASGDPGKDEYSSCRNLINTSQLGKEVIGASSVEPGQMYCAMTTKGATMLITVEEMVDKGTASDESSASFYVKLLKG